jgi:nucleotide-binding universal stress UspA family protein
VADQEEQVLRRELMALSGKLGLVQSDSKSGNAATVAFVEETGRQVDVIKRHGRLADLIAVAQPDVDRNLGTNTLKAALFRSGRPVLMCPPKDAPPTALGVSVAVAWNGSAEAARALAQSMPVIRHASKVTLLTNGSDAGPGTTIQDVLEYLAAHGVTAEIVKFDSGKSVPKALLAAAKASGADMLIMGAYGDSHERETMFGGNTQVIVDDSDLPVLFSH